MGLAIGVTGHRLGRLEDCDLAALADAIDAVFDAVERRCLDAGTQVSRLVTSLADGADTIAADRALARGWPVDAVLPFAREDYALDFADATRELTPRLVAARGVFELPGDRDADAEAGYERAGRVMLAQSDLVVAVWDGEPARGRGGAAQIISEAVDVAIPVIQVDPARPRSPLILWDGLIDEDLGGESLETVARADLHALPRVLASLTAHASTGPSIAASRPRLRFDFAYSLLLAALRARRLRWTDIAPARIAPQPVAAATAASSFSDRAVHVLDPSFAHADSLAGAAARRFRSAYVINYAFAAVAVMLSLIGLALPSALKPVLAALEFLVIATILVQTRAGQRAGWQRQWLENRHLAERLRCLRLSARLGDLGLRIGADETVTPADDRARQIARALGMPDVAVDDAYLARLRGGLLDEIRDQRAYAAKEAHTMHLLEHRLHRLGLFLFGATALACAGLFAFELYVHLSHNEHLAEVSHVVVIAATIVSAAFPAVGAAIYGIRMQGDFAGIARRGERLGRHLTALEATVGAEDAKFDTLRRRIDRLTELLLADVSSWRQAYQARPLSLPG